MKKVILLIVAILGIASANAQFKESGFKMIGEVGTGISSATVNHVSAFGYISPCMDVSFGGNVDPHVFIGCGVGYNALIGVSDCKGGDASHELKLFAHSRFYLSPEGQGAIFDAKVGYKSNFTNEVGGVDVFAGPGFMFGGNFTISGGFAGTFYDGMSLYGGAIKFGIEF